MEENENKGDIFDKLSWIFTFFAVMGSLANIEKLWWSFAIWTVCNVYFIIHNLVRKEKAMTCLFFVYLIISLWGLIKWFTATS